MPKYCIPGSLRACMSLQSLDLTANFTSYLLATRKQFKAMWSVMNEFQQINGLWFTHSKALTEISSQMKALANRYIKKGLLGPDYFYSDSCCSDASFLTKIWPHLAGDTEYDTVGDDMLQELLQGSSISKMPLLGHTDREVSIIDTRREVAQACANIYRSTITTSNKIPFVGCDMEWSVTFGSTPGKVATLQIAASNHTYISIFPNWPVIQQPVTAHYHRICCHYLRIRICKRLAST